MKLKSRPCSPDRSHVALTIMLTVLVCQPTVSFAQEAPDKVLRAIRSHTEQIMTRCRQLETQVRRATRRSRQSGNEGADHQTLNQLRNRIQLTCSDVSATGYAVLEYANRLLRECLGCLGKEGVCMPDEARRCQSDSENLTDKNHDFALHRNSLQGLLVQASKLNLPHISPATKQAAPLTDTTASTHQERPLRQRFETSAKRAKTARARCDRLLKSAFANDTLRDACTEVETSAQNLAAEIERFGNACVRCLDGNQCDRKWSRAACRGAMTKYQEMDTALARTHAKLIARLPALSGESPKGVSAQATQTVPTAKRYAISGANEKDKGPDKPSVTEVSATSPLPMPGGSAFGPGPWAQFGSFVNEYYAKKLTAKIRGLNDRFPKQQARYDRELVRKRKNKDVGYYYRVRVGPFASNSEVAEFCREMANVSQLNTCKRSRAPKLN